MYVGRDKIKSPRSSRTISPFVRSENVGSASWVCRWSIGEEDVGDADAVYASSSSSFRVWQGRGDKGNTEKRQRARHRHHHHSAPPIPQPGYGEKIERKIRCEEVRLLE